MRIITNDETLLRYVPHSIKPASGEKSLFEKIEVHLKAAEDWVERTFLGNIPLPISEEDLLWEHLRQLVAAEALYNALPALDIIMTSNGFGVVNTNNIAAASKHRTDRLEERLLEIRDKSIEGTLSWISGLPEWKDKPQAKFFRATLFPRAIDLPLSCGVTTKLWEKYLELRDDCIVFEDKLADEYISPELLTALRESLQAGDCANEAAHVIKTVRWQVANLLLGRKLNEQRMLEIVEYIRKRPEIFPQWHTSFVAETFSPPVFKNDKNAGGYWF